MVEPGKALYIDIDDINKKEAPVFTRDKTGSGFDSVGTISKGGVRSGSSSSRRAANQRLIEKQAADAAAKQAQQVAAQQQRARDIAAQQQAEAEAKKQTQVIQSYSQQQDRYNYGQGTQVQPPPQYNQRQPTFMPTIETRQVGFERDGNKNIPFVEFVFVEPPQGGVGQYTETRIRPQLTPEGKVFNIEGYEPVTIGNELEIIPLTTTQEIFQSIGGLGAYERIKGGAVGAYEDLNIGLTESITEPTIGQIDFNKARKNVESSTEFLIDKGVPTPIATTGEFISGFGLGLAEDIKYNPAKYAVIATASAGAGLVIGGATVGATTGATAIGGAKAGAITGASIKLVTTGAGLYFGGQYVSQTITRIKEEPDIFGKGAIAGISFGESIVGVSGFKAGTKGFDVLRGLYSTRGRMFIDIPQGKYPTAPPKNQLSMFKNNLYPELGNKPGAFHTTSDLFWNKGSISPQVGTSELPGLYGSTMISTPFARISGTSGKFSFKNFFTNIFKVPGKPAVGYLQPEGFRYSPATRTTNFADGQKFSFSFNKPSRPGYADVPGIKSEIEAIFRPEAGGYTISSQKFYTNIKGVRVPIDTFSYDSSVVSSTTSGVNLKGGASSYSGYSPTRSYPVIPIVTSSSVTPTSTTSITPTYSSFVSSSSVPSSSVPSYSSPTTSGSSRRGGSSRGTSISSSSITPSISQVSSSIKIPSSSLKSSVASSSSISNLYSGSSVSRSQSYAPKITKPPAFAFLKGFTPTKQRRGNFQVFGRRFGQFKIVGVGKTERQALGIGKIWASKTLGATFKVPKAKALKVSGFKTKKSKGGDILFIEPGKRRLKRGSGEIPEIQTFKKLKGGKKK